MVTYTCPRCGFYTNKKYNIRKHINKKTMCKHILRDVNPKVVENEILVGNSKGIEKQEHKRIEELLRKVDELKDEVRELKIENRSLKVVHNNNYIENQTINVVVLPHNNPSLDYLTDKDFKYCINRMIMSVPNLIRKIHFNPNHPENHNICISNIKDNYAMTFDGAQWNLCDRQRLIEELIDEYEYKLEEWLENGEKAFPEEMKKFQEYLEKREEDGVLDKVKNEIKFMLYNNRKMVKLA